MRNDFFTKVPYLVFHLNVFVFTNLFTALADRLHCSYLQSRIAHVCHAPLLFLNVA